MITAKFFIDPYLAEYLSSLEKFGKDVEYLCEESGTAKIKRVIVIPDEYYLYDTLLRLTETVPNHIDKNAITGNIEVVIPDVRQFGKTPAYYHYISAESAKIFIKDAKRIFRAELHEYLDKKRADEGYSYEDSAHFFALKYGIYSFSTASMTRQHRRWLDKIRERNEIRTGGKKSYSRKVFNHE